MIRKAVSHYKILEKIGEGGMGLVYKAEDTKLKRTVALKFLSSELMSDPEAKLRFAREAQAAAALVHPNIATIFAFNEWEGQSFIAMEFVDGETLAYLLKGGPLAIDQAVEFILAVADALSLAHKKGVIHRDIKPANIMIVPEISTQKVRQVKVMDFGLAKLREGADITLPGTLMGTLAYMSPEQAQGKPTDHRSDIFSLGAVFYEMLTGQPPFGRGAEASILYRIIHEEPVPLMEQRAEIPEDLGRVISKALVKDPSRRYQNMDEILADLTSYQYNPQTLAEKAGPEKTSIAVLPFDDISPGKENEFLADGMTDELITTLSQNKNLRVIARTSVMKYKEHTKDIRDIGRELGISHIVEGSVRRYKDKLRITAQLINTEDGSHLWADKFDGSVADIFDFQEKVAAEVSGALRVELGGEKKVEVTKILPQAEAYELFLKGKFLQDAPSLANIDRSVATLERAIELDPQYADAYASLASAYMLYYDTGLRPDPEYLTKAREVAQKALDIDDKNTEALFSLASLTFKQGRLENAFQRFNEILKIDPTHRSTVWWHAIILCFSSYFEEALEEADQLLARDPFWPMAHWLHSTIRLYQGMFDASVAEYEHVVVEVPTKLVWLALTYRYAGRMDKAWKAAKKVRQYEPDGVLWPQAFAFLEGAERKGKAILRYIDERIKVFGWDFFIVGYWVASIYAMADEKDEAFRWLDRSIELGNRNHRWFEVDPNLDNLRDDPRFPQMLEKARKEAQKIGNLLF
ncbi:MAG: protein kinase [Candidatus Aminicenantales bacterium]